MNWSNVVIGGLSALADIAADKKMLGSEAVEEESLDQMRRNPEFLAGRTLTLEDVESSLNSEKPSEDSIYWKIYPQDAQDIINLDGIIFFDDLISGDLSPSAFGAANMNEMHVLLSTETALDKALSENTFNDSDIHSCTIYASVLQNIQRQKIAKELNVSCDEKYINSFNPSPGTKGYIEQQQNVFNKVHHQPDLMCAVFNPIVPSATAEFNARMYNLLNKKMTTDSCYKKWAAEKSSQNRENSNKMWSGIDIYAKKNTGCLDIQKIRDVVKSLGEKQLDMFREITSETVSYTLDKNKSLKSFLQDSIDRHEKRTQDSLIQATMETFKTSLVQELQNHGSAVIQNKKAEPMK